MVRTRVLGLAVLAALLVALSLATGSWVTDSPRQRVEPGPKGVDGDTARALEAGVTRWVVGADPAERARVVAEVKAAGGTVDHVAGEGRMLAVSFPDASAASEGVGGLDAMRSVGYVEPDLKTVRALYEPSDSAFLQEWGLSGSNSVHADLAWDVWKGSPDTVIAIVDTGVDADHPDLDGVVDTAEDRDFVNGDTDADDDNDHGTHVAGIAAATIDDGWIVGVSPRSRILPVKVLDSRGYGYISDVAAGVYYAVDHGADVINLSLGSSYEDAAMSAACAYALSKGVSVVAAAGNGGGAAPSYPAAIDGVIGVGAVDSSGSHASFSNYGDAVDVCAPGVGIVSCLSHGSVTWMSGTSMAAPFVSGTLASIRSRWPGLTRTQAEAHLKETAEEKANPGVNYYGAGLVDANSAVRRVPSAFGGEIGDGFPGELLRSALVTGTLDTTNTADVYAIKAYRGQQLRAALAADEGTDFQLRLCPPGSHNASVSLANAVGSDTMKSLTFTAPSSGIYYLCVRRVAGAGDYSLTFRPGVVLTAPRPAGVVRAGGSQRWNGYLNPHHVAGEHSVEIRCYRWTGHAWLLRKTVSARNYDSGTGTRYSVRFTLAPRGRWKLVPYAAADAAHVATKGPSRLISVR